MAGDVFKREKGFTLVEVLASIVIISIILLGVGQLMLFANKTATSNNTKLVTTHLAKATIARIKIEPEAYFLLESVTEGGDTFDKSSCMPHDCQSLYEFYVNDETYDVIVRVSQNSSERDLNLFNVHVTVKHSSRPIQSSVEGYVVDETS